MVTEAGKEDAAATAFRLYKAMPEDQRTEFMSALGLMAKSFPADSRNGFFANMAKSGARAMDGLPREALSAFMSNMLSISYMGGTIGSIEPDGSPQPGLRFNTPEGSASQQAEFMARQNFSADVRRIQDEAFNPVLNTEGKAPGGLARAAYAFPGLMAFTAEAEIPGIGLPLMFLSMQTQANDQLRQNLIQGGMKEEAASHLAGNLAPFVALPQAALMKANAGLWLGKLPMFEKVFDRIGDQFTTTITRLGMRAAAADVTGQAIMEGMSLVPHITQQVVHALDSDVPDVNWGGKGGVFDGFWARTVEGMATLAPLAILGAAGGISADARAKAFAAATPKELAALGWKPDAIDGRPAAMAKGLSSMGRLIDVGMLGADPHSEGAQTAADELIREHMGKTLLAAQANDSGLFPDLVHTRDGWIVKDRETGNELGQAPDISGAMKIVETHYAAFDDLNEHHVAYITSLMEAAQESRKLGDGGEDHSISMELDNAMTEAKMVMENPAEVERFQKQVELKERLNGGDGSFANAALGVAVPGHDGMGPEERLFQGADVTTTFHETFHRLRREARAAGRLTRADEIAVLRSLDKVMGSKRTKEGPDGKSEALRFLPDGIADADITDMMLDEGCGEIGSMQILKSRKGGGPLNIDASTRANPNFITRNLLSIAARVSPEAAEAIQKFTNFIAAVRARWSLAMQRSLALKKAERDVTFDKSTYEAYLNKLTGRDAQLEHDARVHTEARDIYRPDLEEDNIPFATGDGSPILPGRKPIYSSDSVQALRHDKTEWQRAGYGKAGAVDIVNKYYKTAAFAGIPKDAVLVPVPSTSGNNILPDALAERIGKDFGNTIEKRPAGMALAAGEAKNKRTFFDKVADPVRFEPVPETLAALKELGRPIFITEDVHNTGESWIAFARMLQDNGLEVAGVAALTSTEQRMTSPRDIERLSEKVAAHLGKGLDEVLPAMQSLFRDSFKQLTNKAENDITKSQAKAARLLEIALSGGSEGAFANPLRSGGEGESGILEGQGRREGDGLSQGSFSFATGDGSPILPGRSPERLHEDLLDKIGENALRVEQPRARYEDKRQLLLDFSKSILGPAQKGHAADSSTRLGALSVLAQKFAQKLATDLQVRFIGDTISDTAGLVMRAQALRNPLFETFYLLGMDGSTLKGVMAVTSRIPCSAMIHETGQDWDTGSDAHAEFLSQCGASEYYLLHNHPSGDPSPSGHDIKATQRHALEMDKRGFAMREHLVINHLTYTSIDRTGRASGGELPGKADPANVDPFTSKITHLGFPDALLTPEDLLRAATQVQANKGREDVLTGFVTDIRLKVVAILQGTIDQFKTLTPESIHDFSREQGGAVLMITGVAKDFATANQMARDLMPLNASHVLKEAGFELPGTGDYFSALESGTFRQTERFFGADENVGVRVQEPAAFATGPAELAGFMAGDALRRIKDPLRRVQAMSRIARNFQELKLVNERLELLAGGKRVGKSLLKEAAMREAMRHEEL
ncbi:MAG: JAB domain-containing protein, partial [Verrucomicrobiota bacterium]